MRLITPRRMGAAALITKPVVHAMRAVIQGTATPDQAKRAMAWVVNAVAEVDTASAAGTPHEMAFVEGRRSVGAEIRAVAYMAVADIEKLED